MQFAIPAATSITSLFVIKTDFYTNKDTGEVRASVQALFADSRRRSRQWQGL